MKYVPLVVLASVSLICASTAGEDPGGVSAGTQELYEKWTGSVAGTRIDPKNPHYLKLLDRPDADLAFLRGLHHKKDPVRRLSRSGLATLKTDRSFDVLVRALGDSNMFVRERSLRALGAFAQPRCVPVLLEVLKGDSEPQLRLDAAYVLQDYGGKEVVQALLGALQDQERVATTAAYSLGKQNAAQAIKPVFDLILRARDGRMRGTALGGLRQQRHKEAIPLLLELMERLPAIDLVWGKGMARAIDGDLLAYAKLTESTLGPPPDTIEQWRDWWGKAEPLFAENMTLQQKPETTRDYRAEEFGTRPEELTLSISLDAKSYRIGDPMRMDISLKNGSKQPYRLILPHVPSPWWPTMAYGVRLERVMEQPKVMLDMAPSGFYLGSYSGAPPFETLPPGQTFRDSICLQHWLRGKKVWPLPEGEYALAISFDSSKFPGVNPKGIEVVHWWSAPAAKFTVAGAARRDPKELLRIIGEKNSMPWLSTDLTSRRRSRKAAAWGAVREYGDSRLTPLLRTLTGKQDLSGDLRWGPLRTFKPANQQPKGARP